MISTRSTFRSTDRCCRHHWRCRLFFFRSCDGCCCCYCSLPFLLSEDASFCCCCSSVLPNGRALTVVCVDVASVPFCVFSATVAAVWVRERFRRVTVTVTARVCVCVCSSLSLCWYGRICLLLSPTIFLGYCVPYTVIHVCLSLSVRVCVCVSSYETARASVPLISPLVFIV